MPIEKTELNPQLKWDLAPLFLRLAVGATFVLHGSEKVFLETPEALVGMTGTLPWPWDVYPLFSAYLLAFGEFALGLMALVGLFTRFAAAGLMVIMFVAISHAHWNWPDGGFWALFSYEGFQHFYSGPAPGKGMEWPVLLFFANASLLLTGGGVVSLEAALFSKRFADRSWIWRLWDTIALRVLGPVMITIAMALLYFVVLLPFQFVRLKDPLRRRPRPGSFWEARARAVHTLDRMARRF